MLKRLSDAERDGDSIHGVIIGSGINQDGKTNGITAPSVNSQIDLLREVYAGTASTRRRSATSRRTAPAPSSAIRSSWKRCRPCSRSTTAGKNLCALGSVKTNLGHTSGAAGVAGVHKVLLSLRNKDARRRT